MEPSEWFWSILDSVAGEREALRRVLEGLTEQQIYEFQSEFAAAVAELRDEPFTVHMENSEDGVEDIARWVVSQGSEAYKEVFQHPELLPYSSDDLDLTNSLHGVAVDVYEERFGMPLHIMV